MKILKQGKSKEEVDRIIKQVRQFECSRCAYEPQNEHVPTAFCCNCGMEMDEYTDLVQSCETCKFFNNRTLWCSQYNDTTYHPNCSSYKAIE